MFTVSETSLGTPESTWLNAEALAHCAPLHFGPPGRVVVLAPHPDDEVLGVGGTLQLLAAAGWSVCVVAITDGEASHPGSPAARATLARIRAEERANALACLSLSEAEVVRLQVGDGLVTRASDLDERLAPHLRDASLCLSPWEHDGHPDHDATGLAARRACRTLGVPLLRYPVWAWHWASPEHLPWTSARKVPLPPEVQRAKRKAIAAYRSQIAPLGPAPGEAAVLPPAVLARFERPFEILFA